MRREHTTPVFPVWSYTPLLPRVVALLPAWPEVSGVSAVSVACRIMAGVLVGQALEPRRFRLRDGQRQIGF